MTDFSRDKLLGFLKDAGMNGLMNPAVARSRRIAAEQLLENAEAKDINDLRQLDLKALEKRIAKQSSTQIRPEVAGLYCERLASALEDFFLWSSDPQNFQSTPGETALRQRNEVRGEHQEAQERIELGKASTPSDLLPIPIRADRIVYLQNLPLALSSTEADKIKAVIDAFVTKESN